MKLSILFAAVIVLVTAGSASAAGWIIGTAPGTTEADCTNSGGTVVVDSQGHKICIPRPVRTDGGAPGREPTN
ncbi:MAG: hypothetical protein ISS15_01085 [Alphaproteobacteria bacterium]|nr:hypothetical protein [Alphaproteobacteria bacterium]MBL7096225.1 hypothetical protein [Alphaproteobacteria bacterium]